MIECERDGVGKECLRRRGKVEVENFEDDSLDRLRMERDKESEKERLICWEVVSLGEGLQGGRLGQLGSFEGEGMGKEANGKKE